MGTIGTVTPAALVAGITWSGDFHPITAQAALEEAFGPIALEGDPYFFDMTDYYTVEMGPGLMKRFVAFERPIEIDRLPAIKRETNEIERQFARAADPHRRTVNIDPGYVTLAKLVLASTKDFSHRIYLGGGIFGQAMLRFRNGAFEPLEFAYPDYASPAALAFFAEVRNFVKRNRWTT